MLIHMTLGPMPAKKGRTPCSLSMPVTMSHTLWRFELSMTLVLSTSSGVVTAAANP